MPLLTTEMASRLLEVPARSAGFAPYSPALIRLPSYPNTTLVKRIPATPSHPDFKAKKSRPQPSEEGQEWGLVSQQEASRLGSLSPGPAE